MSCSQKQSPATSVSDYLSQSFALTLGSWLRDRTPLTDWLTSIGRARG